MSRKAWDDLDDKGRKLGSVFRRLNTLADRKLEAAMQEDGQSLDQYLRLTEAIRQYARTIAELKETNKELGEFEERLKALEEAAEDVQTT